MTALSRTLSSAHEFLASFDKEGIAAIRDQVPRSKPIDSRILDLFYANTALNPVEGFGVPLDTPLLVTFRTHLDARLTAVVDWALSRKNSDAKLGGILSCLKYEQPPIKKFIALTRVCAEGEKAAVLASASTDLTGLIKTTPPLVGDENLLNACASIQTDFDRFLLHHSALEKLKQDPLFFPDLSIQFIQSIEKWQLGLGVSKSSPILSSLAKLRTVLIGELDE